ncbi:MAG: PIG-L family deacetylase [Nitrospiraceae bacterium]|nr:MAG: PIG-L family deacetylase [Nitrospiraceae bacterium]
MPADIMVIFAHPDDAEFGIGGTVARWTAEGKRVVYVACTSGDKGTSDRAMQPHVLAEMREREQEGAARVLGVQDVMFLRYPDQGLEDTAEFRKRIVRTIRTFRPEIVVTLDPYRRYVWHRDHRIVGQVTLDALFPYARDHLAYPDLLEEGLTPHKVKEALFWGSEEVNYRSDITTTFSLKVAALLCHESQVRDMARADMEERLRTRSRAMAEGEAFELGEAFYRISFPL